MNPITSHMEATRREFETYLSSGKHPLVIIEYVEKYVESRELALLEVVKQQVEGMRTTFMRELKPLKGRKLSDEEVGEIVADAFNQALSDILTALTEGVNKE